MHFLPLSHLLTAVKPEHAGNLLLLRGMVREHVSNNLAWDHHSREETIPALGSGKWDDLLLFSIHGPTA